MAKKKRRKITPEEQAEFDRRTEMINQRIADRRARERALGTAEREQK